MVGKAVQVGQEAEGEECEGCGMVQSRSKNKQAEPALCSASSR